MSGINQDINALVQADIDGTISPEDRSRLQGLLDSREDVRDYHDDARRLVDGLDGLEELDAPAGLEERVMAELRKPSGVSTRWAFASHHMPMRPSSKQKPLNATSRVVGTPAG